LNPNNRTYSNLDGEGDEEVDEEAERLKAELEERKR